MALSPAIMIGFSNSLYQKALAELMHGTPEWIRPGGETRGDGTGRARNEGKDRREEKEEEEEEEEEESRITQNKTTNEERKKERERKKV
jgi:hypothetical protein